MNDRYLIGMSGRLNHLGNRGNRGRVPGEWRLGGGLTAMSITRARGTTPRRNKQCTVRTTTIEIERPHDFAELERRFRIERYVLPEHLRFVRGPQASTVFERVHAALHDQLDEAYKSYKFDTLDRDFRWAVYVLLPRDAEPPSVRVPPDGTVELPHRPVHFAELPFHITVKLLQIYLFHGPAVGRFVCNDNCYTYVRSTKGDYHYCVQVKLEGVITNQESDAIHAFQVIPEATRLGPVDLAKWTPRPWDAVFGKRAVDGRFHFLRLKSGQGADGETMYQIVTFPGSRARVKYHNPRHIDAGRGKILYDFILTFLAYLQRLGITGHPRQRMLTHFKAPVPRMLALDFSRLGSVGVYDNRLARGAHSLGDYVDLFARMRPDVTFTPIEGPLEQVADLSGGSGLLVLLDAHGADFASEGILAGQSDPYQALYQATPTIPKQSLVVNSNDPNALAGGNYLEYPFPVADRSFTLKLEASLNDLYLKCVLARGFELLPLPLLPSGATTTPRAFVRKRREHGVPYTTALWFENGHLRFADLGDPPARQRFLELVAGWNVDYLECFRKYCENYLRRRDDPPTYDLVLGPDLFVAIDNLNERVLYDYEEVVRRQRERSTLHPIEEFQLARHYDVLKSTGMLPLIDLRALPPDRRVSDTVAIPVRQRRSSKALARSQAFYAQLCAYDELLDEIARTQPTMTFNELLRGAWAEDIVRIFGDRVSSSVGDSKGASRARPKRLLKRYGRLHRFLGERGNDVLLSQGIWHDSTGAFMAGGTTAMPQDGQDNAHLFRRFLVLQGSEHFDHEELLAAMAVQFVRPRQYTVKPYQFHLIDLHVDMLQHGAVTL